MPIYLGSQKIKTLYVGGQKIKEAWTMVGGVLTKVYSAIPPFTPSGMTKTSNYSGSAVNSTYKTIPGWTADAGSTVSSNGLVSNSTKIGATLAATVVASTSFSGATVTLRLQVDGVTVATGPTSTFSGGSWNSVPSVSTTRDIAAGDVVTVQWSCGPSENWLSVVAAGTYVRIT